MKTETTRNDLISDRGQFETLEQDFAEGRRTEREVIVALIRGWLRVLDFLNRRTWGLGQRSRSRKPYLSGRSTAPI